jgi:taurine dioxygenase
MPKRLQPGRVDACRTPTRRGHETFDNPRGKGILQYTKSKSPYNRNSAGENELQIKPLSEHVGAEIGGVNLATDLSDGTFERIDDAYNRYSVIVFPDQRLTPEQQIAFARRFGELEISPRTEFALPGYPEILVLSNIIENGKPIGNADAGRTWHTDMSYTKTPPRGSLLYAREIPIENGRALGDTIFASAAAAFESLPADKQASLLGLRAIHRGSAKKYAPGSKLGDRVKDIPDVEHPVIRTHPVTGRKAIYVREGECVGICNMPDEQSLSLIKELADMVTRPEFCYRHQWGLGDLLMWDNSITQHLAISDYQLPLRRLMHRVTVNGTVPI